MPYELKESPETIQLSVSAPSREELFRDALTGVLAATYGAPLPEGTSEGRVVPLQAAGDDDDVLLAGLVEEALRAIQEEPGTLRPPRWLAFDVNRVTANLPVHALEVRHPSAGNRARGSRARRGRVDRPAGAAPADDRLKPVAPGPPTLATGASAGPLPDAGTKKTPGPKPGGSVSADLSAL